MPSSLAIEHRGFVEAIAKEVCQARNCDYLFEDLVQEGAVALIESVGRFDPGRGVKFTTYAYKRVKGTMHDYIDKEHARGPKIPRPLSDLARLCLQAHDKLIQQLMREPTTEEIAKKLSVEVEKVEEALKSLEQVESLDELREPSEEGKGALEPPGREEPLLKRIITQERDETLHIAIRMLRPEFAAVLYLFYFDGWTEEETAKALNAPLGTVKGWKNRAKKPLGLRMAVLWEYDEYSDEEVSERTDVPVKTVKEWREGRRVLRLYLFKMLITTLISERTGLCLEIVKRWTEHADQVNMLLKNARQQNHLTDDELVEYHGGICDEPSRERIEVHLRRCFICQGRLEEMTEIQQSCFENNGRRAGCLARSGGDDNA